MAPQVEAEIATHRWLSHPAVPPLRDVFLDEDNSMLHMVFDYGGARAMGGYLGGGGKGSGLDGATLVA